MSSRNAVELGREPRTGALDEAGLEADDVT